MEKYLFERSVDFGNYCYKAASNKGEVLFDELAMERIQMSVLMLNDLLLEQNHSYFQIDSLLVTQGMIHLFDVKNFEGIYVYKDDNFYLLGSNNDLQNPLEQLKRCERLLRKRLQENGINLPIKSHLIFINPKFTLLQAPLNETIILPTQLDHFFEKMNRIQANVTEKHVTISEKIMTYHKGEYPLVNVPTYTKSTLKYGNYCLKCHSFDVSVVGVGKLVCIECGFEESADQAVLRCVEEIGLLFPGEKIMTNLVQHWCGGAFSKKVICRVLKGNYTIKGYGQWTYYE
ncbi:nuclease-related domain-containing protein [Bacillus sp. JJ1764]|uniref:nuclease-related domain-containing protein n=1 Tax=Bacillus sp. JJ1764 TaxID=3122964 RepID=UPI002FFF409C